MCFKCQAFDKAAYRESADDWLIDPKPDEPYKGDCPDLYSESYRSTIDNDCR
jgi:hypothetical protein